MSLLRCLLKRYSASDLQLRSWVIPAEQIGYTERNRALPSLHWRMIVAHPGVLPNLPWLTWPSEPVDTSGLTRKASEFHMYGGINTPPPRHQHVSAAVQVAPPVTLWARVTTFTASSCTVYGDCWVCCLHPLGLRQRQKVRASTRQSSILTD